MIKRITTISWLEFTFEEILYPGEPITSWKTSYHGKCIGHDVFYLDAIIRANKYLIDNIL